MVSIKAIYVKTHNGYGWPSTWKELLARGVRVGKEQVQKLMQLHDRRAEDKRRFKVTTDGNHDLPIAPNLQYRQFTVAGVLQGLGGRHHLHARRRRLAVPGGVDRHVQPPGGGLALRGQGSFCKSPAQSRNPSKKGPFPRCPA